MILERQNTFRPVFGALLKATRTERLHASHLRRLLAENDIDFNKLKQAWDKGAKQELEELLKKEVATANDQDITDLLEILDCFFDPDKKPVEPKPRMPRDFTRKPRERDFKDGKKEGSTNNNKSLSESSATGAPNLNDSPSGTSSETTPRTDVSAEQAVH